VSEPIDPREQLGEHAEWDALAVAWALSALDPEDEERFAEHLPGCTRCTATVRESLYTVADLAYALPDEAPPPSLKARLRAAVAAEPRTSGAGPEPEAPVEPEPEQEWPLGKPHPGSPGYGVDWFARPARPEPGADEGDLGIHQPPVGERRTRPRPAPAADQPTTETRRPDLPIAGPPQFTADRPPQPTADRPPQTTADRPPQPPAAGPIQPPSTEERPEESAEVVSLGGRRRRVVRWVAIGVAAAAVVALVAGLLVSNVHLRDQKDDLRRVVAQRDTAIAQLTANGPAKVAALTADGQPSPDRRATLVVRGDHIEIIVESLGPTTGNETYWLWTLRCDTPKPTDLKPIRGFTVTQSDFSVRDIGSDPGVASAPCFAISSEEGTATPKAPRQVVAVGQPR
jgi:anti-sigma-K factor RskA